MKKLYLFITALLLSSFIWSQTVSMESFEDETKGATFFTSNGQVFDIGSQTGYFAINQFAQPLGWNGTAADNYFIDNNNAQNLVPVEFTIATRGAVPFTLKSMWLYYSNSNLDRGTGTITITGLKGGVTVFTATASLASPTDSSTNLFAKFDMTTYGGADNSNKVIDRFVIKTTGDFEYISLDALTWATSNSAVPVHLSGFTGYLKKGTAYLEWKTGSETSFDHFDVEKAAANNTFSTVGRVSAKGDNSLYNFRVLQAEPAASYRLKMVDILGKFTYSGTYTVSGMRQAPVVVYPNPAHDFINIRAKKDEVLTIYDASGKIVKTATLRAGFNEVEIIDLGAGLYYGKIGTQKFSFIKN